jgi:hypothetical protein
MAISNYCVIRFVAMDIAAKTISIMELYKNKLISRNQTRTEIMNMPQMIEYAPLRKSIFKLR